MRRVAGSWPPSDGRAARASRAKWRPLTRALRLYIERNDSGRLSPPTPAFALAVACYDRIRYVRAELVRGRYESADSAIQLIAAAVRVVAGENHEVALAMVREWQSVPYGKPRAREDDTDRARHTRGDTHHG